MKQLDKVLLTAKRCYKNSIVNDCDDLQDDLLSIIVMLENYLNNTPAPKHRSATRESISDEKYRDMAYVAYVLSEFEHTAFDSDKTQGQVIDHLASILSTKTSTLRNMRDSLDSHTNSRREGWKMALNDRLQDVFNDCIAINPPENVIIMAKNILHKYEKERK